MQAQHVFRTLEIYIEPSFTHTIVPPRTASRLSAFSQESIKLPQTQEDQHGN